jgi:acyl carrier protein
MYAMEAQADLRSFVCDAIRRSCNDAVETIDLSTPLAAFSLDSLMLVSLVAQVQTVYEVELSPAEIVSLVESYRVSDLIGRLQELIGERAAGAAAPMAVSAAQ